VRKVLLEYLQDFLMYPHEKEGLKQAVWRVDPAQAGIVGTMETPERTVRICLNTSRGANNEVCADFATFLLTVPWTRMRTCSFA